jgi:hypothetical protein
MRKSAWSPDRSAMSPFWCSEAFIQCISRKRTELCRRHGKVYELTDAYAACQPALVVKPASQWWMVRRRFLSMPREYVQWMKHRGGDIQPNGLNIPPTEYRYRFGIGIGFCTPLQCRSGAAPEYKRPPRQDDWAVQTQTPHVPSSPFLITSSCTPSALPPSLSYSAPLALPLPSAPASTTASATSRTSAQWHLALYVVTAARRIRWSLMHIDIKGRCTTIRAMRSTA